MTKLTAPSTNTEELELERGALPQGTKNWPRITLVTAVRNGARYLEDTIRSIVDQGYPNLEYIVVDGVSTDGTLEIIRKYETQLSWWVSQPDGGVYEALNTGFARSSGEILGWLNASDILHPNSLFVLGSVFAAFPEVEWLTGRPTVLNAQSMTVQVQRLPRWSRSRFLAGANQHIQQESTFLRRSLWERAGGCVDAGYRDVGDFELWVRLFRHAPLYSLDTLIGGYRMHSDALSWGNIERYNQRCDAIIGRELASMRGGSFPKLFRWIGRVVKPIPKVRGLWQRIAINALYRLPGPDWPPVIADLGNGWEIRR